MPSPAALCVAPQSVAGRSLAHYGPAGWIDRPNWGVAKR